MLTLCVAMRKAGAETKSEDAANVYEDKAPEDGKEDVTFGETVRGNAPSDEKEQKLNLSESDESDFNQSDGSEYKGKQKED